jgi:hypothetical protein
MEIPADKTDAGTDVDVTLSPVVVNKDSVRWEALVLPHTPSQAATAGRFFAFTLGGKTYEYKMANETFEKGTKYRYDFMLSGPPKITPQPPTTAPDGMTNCYMVAPGGTVTFRVSRAYTFEDDEFTNTLRVDNVDIYPHEFTPVVLWEDADVIIDEKLAVSGKGKNAKLTVETNSSPGNAVVAIKVGNTIVWSYHIWVTEYAPDGTNTFTANSGYVFMNRNLGATHYNLEDGVKTFGLLYQWGRKDPFPGSISGAAGWSTGGIDSGFEGLGSGGTTLTGNNDTGIKTSIKNPQCFYIYNPANYNWLPDIDNNLWNQATTNQKTIYDPCPSGWRVPAFLANTLDADHSPWKGYASLSGTDTWGKWPSGTLTGGMIFGHTTADRNQNAQHPAAGGRAYSIGTGADWGYRGFYWTGTHTSTYTTVIMFFKWDGEINLVEVSPRAAGFSVRCVQE